MECTFTTGIQAGRNMEACDRLLLAENGHCQGHIPLASHFGSVAQSREEKGVLCLVSFVEVLEDSSLQGKQSLYSFQCSHWSLVDCVHTLCALWVADKRF